MIPDDVIERVRTSADLAQIVSEFGVKLRRMGSDFRGPCPFHQGTKPNFSVSSKRGTYHCFVCGESGDVFTFVRKKVGLDWPAAVKYVGERVGIEVIDTPSRAHAPDPNERNWEVLSVAASWFHAQLLDEGTGRDARHYLTNVRKLSAAAIEQFGLGFAPRDGQLLRRHLHTLGFDDARQLEAGLLALPENATEPRPRFHGRVMFPIVDEIGHHVAFGGRAMGDNEPKYLNSPESPVFQKRRTLYGLHTAKHAIRRAGRVVLVEGYLDAIRVALAGIEEVVAPLGTALTEEQADLLVRFAKEVFLVYDSDEAGQKATLRSGLELLRHKAAVRVVTLPDGEDPDSFVLGHGRAGLENLLSQALDLFDRQVQIRERKGWFKDLTKQRRAIDSLLVTIRAARDPLTRDQYLTRLAEVTRLEKSNLANEVDEPAHTGAGSRGRGPGPQVPHAVQGNDDAHPAPRSDYSSEPGSSAPPERSGAGSGDWKARRARVQGPQWRVTWVPPARRIEEPAERALISAMLADRALVERIAERVGPSGFHDPGYRELFETLLRSSPELALDEIAEQLNAPGLAALRELLDRADGRDSEGIDVTLNLVKLDARRIEDRLREIREQIGRAPVEQQKELQHEQKELSVELQKLAPVRSPRGKASGERRPGERAGDG